MRVCVCARGVIGFSDDFSEPCCCGACCSSGHDSVSLDWPLITSTPSVNEAGRGCGPWKIDSYISLFNIGFMPGVDRRHHAVGGASLITNLYVDNPREVAGFIAAVRAKYYSPSLTDTVAGFQMGGLPSLAGLGRGAVTAQALVAAQPKAAAVRTFVAAESSPDNFVVFMVASGAPMSAILAEAAQKVGMSGLPVDSLVLELAGVGARISSASEINANDKLLLRAPPPSYPVDSK